MKWMQTKTKVKNNKSRQSHDAFGLRDYEASLVFEEFKALKKGETSYCFSEKQFNEIKKLCETHNIVITYSEDEDGIFTIVPESCIS